MNFSKIALQRKVKEVNLLLLGETGAGKSTAINAIANYLKYPSFQEALNGDFIELIPCKIELIHPETGNTVTIQSAKGDPNERMTSGNSSTKDPKAYVFKLGSTVVRIIDTPGIGDTEGINQDKKNFDSVLRHLQTMQNLHGICILLKTTETRVTDFFKYCIAELLTQLHKSACQNIVFCYTFGRCSYFKPGDGFFALKNFLLKELPEVKLELKSKENCFFIDNEAYRFLLIKKSGKYPFNEGEERGFMESWNQSIEQIDKLMEHIIGIAPHDLENTISLNSARKLIYQLAEPIVMLKTTIDANVSHIANKEAELTDKTKNKLELAKDLNIYLDNIESKNLPYPTTVCTDNKCTDLIDTDKGKQVYYKQRCHEKCKLTGVSVNIIGYPHLQFCAAMTKETGICRQCNCPWQAHKHITFEFKLVKKLCINQNQQIKIETEDEAILAINETLRQARSLKGELEGEMRIIQDVSAKFAYILLENSNTQYNKFLEPYLKLLIKEELKKIDHIKDYSRVKLTSLENLLKAHLEQVTILQKAIESRSISPIEIKDIFKFGDQLTQLKHSGGPFKQMLAASDWRSSQTAKRLEMTVNISQTEPHRKACEPSSSIETDQANKDCLNQLSSSSSLKENN